MKKKPAQSALKTVHLDIPVHRAIKAHAEEIGGKIERIVNKILADHFAKGGKR